MPATTFAAISGDDIIHKLIPNWVSFVTQLAAFLVLIAIVFFLAYKPVKKIIKKRQDYIEDNIKQSEIAKSRAKDNVIKSEETLTSSHKKANEMIEEAKKEALKEKEAILLEAQEEVKKLKLESEKDIEQSKADAIEDIRKEMVDLALDASSEILSRNVNNEDNAKLADDFIRSVKK